MEETASRMREEEAAIAHVCDSCGKREESPEEVQEWLSWRHRGGYLSVFGDGEDLSLDLCQDCTRNLLSSFIQKNGNAYGF